MNRLEFLTSLRYNLEKGGLPREDIEDALSYYEEIFLDAGYGSDEQTARTLGDPEALAKEILIENGIHPDGDAAFEVGEARRVPFEDVQDVAFEEVGKENTEQNGSYNYGYGYTGSENTAHTNNSQYGSSQTSGGIFFDAATKVNQALDGALHGAREAYDRNFNDPTMTAEQKTARNNNLLKVLLIIVTFPLWIGVVATVGGLLFGLVAALFGIVIALIAGGFSMVIMGIKLLFTVPPAGIMTIGLGMIFLGIFGLVAKPGFAGIRKLAGKFINGFRGLCGKIFG